MHISEVLAANVRRLRKRGGLTQDALARAAGITRPHVTNLELASFRNVGIETVESVARGLGVTPDQLLVRPRGGK